jgi:hypothetical protein
MAIAPTATTILIAMMILFHTTLSFTTIITTANLINIITVLTTIGRLVNHPILPGSLILLRIIVLAAMDTPTLQLVEDVTTNSIMQGTRKGRNIPAQFLRRRRRVTSTSRLLKLRSTPDSFGRRRVSRNSSPMLMSTVMVFQCLDHIIRLDTSVLAKVNHYRMKFLASNRTNNECSH